MKTKRVFFIVGAPRSGTTLLQTMVMSGSGIFIPPETHFMGRTRACRREYGPLDTPRGFENTLHAIRHHVCESNELPVYWPELDGELRASPRTYADLFDTLLFHMFERRTDCRRMGEKSPNHLLHGDYLLEHFPDARMVNIIRDGRDAAVSHREAFGDERSLLHYALRWRHYQRVYRAMAAKWPGNRVTSVRYEDLVTEPELELRRICRFLDEPFDENMMQQHRRRESGFADREKHKLRTFKPVTRSRIGRFREHLTPTQIAMFQAIAGAELSEHGYTLDPASVLWGTAVAMAKLPGTLLRRHRRVRDLRQSPGTSGGGVE